LHRDKNLYYDNGFMTQGFEVFKDLKVRIILKNKSNWDFRDSNFCETFRDVCFAEWKPFKGTGSPIGYDE